VALPQRSGRQLTASHALHGTWLPTWPPPERCEVPLACAGSEPPCVSLETTTHLCIPSRPQHSHPGIVWNTLDSDQRLSRRAWVPRASRCCWTLRALIWAPRRRVPSGLSPRPAPRPAASPAAPLAAAAQPARDSTLRRPHASVPRRRLLRTRQPPLTGPRPAQKASSAAVRTCCKSWEAAVVAAAPAAEAEVAANSAAATEAAAPASATSAVAAAVRSLARVTAVLAVRLSARVTAAAAAAVG